MRAGIAFVTTAEVVRGAVSAAVLDAELGIPAVEGSISMLRMCTLTEQMKGESAKLSVRAA